MDLLAQIEREGGERAGKIVAEAEAEAGRRLAQAERDIAAEAQAYRDGERHRVEQEQRLVVSRARAQARAVFLKAKSGAAEQVFEALLRETAGLRADAAGYRAFLERCLREVERAIAGPLVLYVDPADQAAVADLIRGTEHRIGGTVKTRGGFVSTDAAGQLVVDDRMETRIANLRQRAQADLGKALFDPGVTA